jgi:hypothetical protein
MDVEEEGAGGAEDVGGDIVDADAVLAAEDWEEFEEGPGGPWDHGVPEGLAEILGEALEELVGVWIDFVGVAFDLVGVVFQLLFEFLVELFVGVFGGWGVAGDGVEDAACGLAAGGELAEDGGVVGEGGLARLRRVG